MQQRQRMALFDIDRTIWRGRKREYSLFPVARFQVTRSLLPKSAVEELRRIYGNARRDGGAYVATCREGNLRGYVAATSDLVCAYAKGLQQIGVSRREVFAATMEYFRSQQGQAGFYAYVKPLLQMLGPTHTIVIVTGEPDVIGDAVGDVVGEVVGAARVLSSHLRLDRNGRFTGDADYLTTSDEKRSALRELLDNADTRRSFAFGDSEGDIGMLESVGHPICIDQPEGHLRATAGHNRWLLLRPPEVLKAVQKILGST